MKKIPVIFLVALSLGLVSMTHKFYVAIYQVNYAAEKKMLQVTSRIFIDDLENALENKYKRDFRLGRENLTAEEKALMQKYFAERFTIKVNGQPKNLTFLSDEIQDDVFICYFRATDIGKITSLEITNKLLFDFVTEQQNIIQTQINGKKSSLLLTPSKPSGKLTY